MRLLFFLIFFWTFIQLSNGQEMINLSVFNNFHPPLNKSCLPEFDSSWREIYSLDTNLIDLLINNRDKLDGINYYDSINNEKFKLGFLDTRTHFFKNTFVPYSKDLYALYLITALYYNNYYFASDKILYRKYQLPKYDSLSFWEKTKTDEDVVVEAWRCIIEWRKKVLGLTLDEINTRGLHPLVDCDLIWIGEYGCTLNPNYYHAPVFYLEVDKHIDW